MNSIAAYEWNFGVVWEYRDIFVNAVMVTISLAAMTIVLGMLLGAVMAILRSSRARLLSGVIAMIVEAVRAVPPLVLLVWLYYCLPILVGVSMGAKQTAVAALAIYSSAFFAEIFRAGIQSIDRGYIEAASACGMTRGQILRRIVGPLAFQRIFPPLVSQCVLVVKNTSLVGYIAVSDILYIGQQVSMQSFRPLEVLTVVAALFLVMIVPLTVMANALEAKYRNKYYG